MAFVFVGSAAAKNPAYKESLKNGSYIYNVLKRMIVKRETVEKTNDGFRAKVAVE